MDKFFTWLYIVVGFFAYTFCWMLGINSGNIKDKGYGETDLKIKNAKTEAEHQANRRTTLKILRQDE